MSNIKKALENVAELYEQGYSVKAIAVLLEMPYETVEEFVAYIDETNYHMDMADELDRAGAT
jgi:orotate phosphoribosyltransferase-like protein